jgi:hypothetical protein
VEEVHRVTLALLRLAEPNHPPGSSETSQQTVSGKENRASEEGGGRASSLPGGDEQGPRGLRRPAAEDDGGGAVDAHQLLAGRGVEARRAVAGKIGEEAEPWIHWGAGGEELGFRGARFGDSFGKGLAVVEDRTARRRAAVYRWEMLLRYCLSRPASSLRRLLPVRRRDVQLPAR